MQQAGCRISKFQYETQSTYFLLLASQNPKEALNG